MKASPYFVRFAGTVTAIATIVTMAVPAGAQTVLVDFGSSSPASYRGLSVLNPDSNGNYWTSFTPGDFPMDLVDTTNTPTTIDLGFSTNIGTDSYNGPAGPTGPGEDKNDLRDFDLPAVDIDAVALGPLGGALEAAFDFFVSPGGADPNTVRFELQGLNPASTYDLTFYGSHIFSIDATTVYSVYTDNTYTEVVDSVSLDVQELDAPNLANRDRVATISGLSPQTDNILFVEFVGSSGNFGYLNALQIDITSPPAVPGDYNGNGVVDAADYTVWRDNLGGSDAAFAADTRNPSLSGAIVVDDYAFWVEQFGASGGASLAPGASGSVPEPATLGLAFVAGALTIACRRRTPVVRQVFIRGGE